MELTQLRYFRAICEAGSLSGAARALGVTQPTLSGAVRGLEDEAGTTLFVRTSTGVVPTPAGLALLETADRVCGEIDRVGQRIRSLVDDDEGEAVIGAHPALGAYFLPGFLAGFLPRWPRIDLRLWSGSSSDVVQAVLDRRVTYGISVNPRPHPDLVMLNLFHDEIRLFVRSARAPDPYGVATGRTAPADDRPLSWDEAVDRVRAGPLIYPSIASFEGILDRINAARLMPARRIPCADLELTKTLALAGIGVAVLPRRVAEYGNDRWLRVPHPDLPHFADVIQLVWRYDVYKSRAMQVVKEALLAHGAALDALWQPAPAGDGPPG